MNNELPHRLPPIVVIGEDRSTVEFVRQSYPARSVIWPVGTKTTVYPPLDSGLAPYETGPIAELLKKIEYQKYEDGELSSVKRKPRAWLWILGLGALGVSAIALIRHAVLARKRKQAWLRQIPP